MERKKEIRWIIFEKDPLRDKHFQLCKPNDNGKYHIPGTRKDMKGFNDIYNQDRYIFNFEDIGEANLTDLNSYRTKRGENPIDLSTKTI